jgi:hypothetical protein
MQGKIMTQRCFENVAQFRYLGMTISQNLIQEEIKRRLNLGNACYHSVQNLLSSRMLSKNIRLRVFENRVLRRIFGPKRDEVTGGFRKLHNEELHNLYSSPSIIRMIKSMRMRWAGHVAWMGEERNAYRILVGKPEGKRPLERPKM